MLIFVACGTLLYSVFNVFIHIHQIQWLPFLTGFSFQCPYGCCTTLAVFISSIEKVLLFSFPSWQCHWSLPAYFKLARSSLCCSTSPLFCGHPGIMYHFSFWRSSSSQVAVSLLLMCLLLCSPMCWWHAHLCSCKWFPGTCSLYGCYGIASLLCTGLGQACK